jgi:hypothetical protein
MIAFLVFIGFALFLVNLASSIWKIISAILDTAILDTAILDTAILDTAEIETAEIATTIVLATVDLTVEDTAILQLQANLIETATANPIVAEIYRCEQETASKLKLSQCEGKYVEVMIAKERSLAAEVEKSLAVERSLAVTKYCCCEEGFTPSSILCGDEELCYNCDKIEL